MHRNTLPRRHVLGSLLLGTTAIAAPGCVCARPVAVRIGKYIGGQVIDWAFSKLLEYLFEVSGVREIWRDFITDEPRPYPETPAASVPLGVDVKFGGGAFWVKPSAVPDFYSVDPVLHHALDSAQKSYQVCFDEWGGPTSTVAWYQQTTGPVGAQWFRNVRNRRLIVFREDQGRAIHLPCVDDYADTAMAYLTGSKAITRWPPGPSLQTLVEAPTSF
jgi:hypothetical protein